MLRIISKFKFDKRVPRDCKDPCVPSLLKYFSRKFLIELKSTPDDEIQESAEQHANKTLKGFISFLIFLSKYSLTLDVKTGKNITLN